ncbi:FKBP-type peptidyl-prolyl cis-trans isomerase SlyD [Cyclobacterium xiamenense]|uniref:Peptidyl-prolyl cis-trans isomerase n=1 Tax=Cyclobacterium xiamenense TaxID=1297121 RepID=A0A1H6WM40_9BACT|nr:FKBP-type peptidyl-prolyl cis-trans isomerase [Cyclobacterium xiamenense]SEJ18091.1 FKBP-type peptidyl-prolyl cis-trans isomerase SlyD [Cyclobacterium xiamenense]
MKINENTVVGLTYELKVTNETSEELPFSVEVRDEADPFYFLYGNSGLPEAFEKKLKEKTKGDRFQFVLEVAEAYGEADDELIVSVPKAQFNTERGFQEEMLQEGNFLPLVDEDGYPMQAKIVKDLGEELLLDFNHPLTGMTLHFEGEVFEVREATEKEKEEGFMA